MSIKVIILIFSFCILISACESSDEKELKAFVVSQFKDPQSTQFQNVSYKDGVMCGEVNSKNGYGAYAGFKKFIVKRDYVKKLGGAFEDSSGFGDGNDVGLWRGMVESTVMKYLLMIKLNKIKAINGDPEVDYSKTGYTDTETTNYLQYLKKFDHKVEDKMTEDELRKIASEVAIPLIFIEASKSCPTK